MRAAVNRHARWALCLLLIGAGSSLTGCKKPLRSSSTSRPAPSATTPATRSPQELQKDRAAILAMAGRYSVTFHFEETVALSKGYEKKPVKDSGAQEWVLVVEERDNFISLQHILIMGQGESQFVLKHWRQDWRYEPQRLLQFTGGNTWTMQSLSDAQRQGQWSQTVYQVDDTPRYGGLGRWEHSQGISQWTSQRAWRPLPRRDMTTRSDYHTLDAVQRHVITPFGWVHEQDNTKVVLRGPAQALTREIGVNSYRTDSALDIRKAKAQWEGAQAYWSAIRDYWHQVEKEQTHFGLTLKGESQALYQPLLKLGEEVSTGKKPAEQAVSEAMVELKKYVTFTPAPLEQRLRPAG